MNKDALLWIGCFRYCLGRKTYVVSEFIDMAMRKWDDVPKQAKDVIKRDLESSIDKALTLGHPVDKADWLKLYEFVKGRQ